MEKQREEIQIDFWDLLLYLKKKLWIVVAAVLLCGVLGAGVTTVFMEDEYTAQTRMYVLGRSDDAAVSYYDYNVANYMIMDYEVLITGENVTREVIQRLQLNMSGIELAKKISVQAIGNTRVLQIVVVDNNPHRAAAIANCVREVSSAQIKEIMDVDAVNLVYEAQVPAGKSGPSLTKNTVIAALAGFVLVVGVLVVLYLLDDTIRTDEDVTQYLGLATLGIIPSSEELETSANLTVSRNQRKPGLLSGLRKK